MGGDNSLGAGVETTSQRLDDVEEELKWLAKMQQEASAGVHHVQHLERSEVALQAKPREVSEEKARLQSTRVDLGDAGQAMRDAIASQNETYVARISGLEEARRYTDEDRKKLMQECADLQARLDALIPEMHGIQELEDKHKELESERIALQDESHRLRDINGALGSLLLGDDGPSMGDEASRGVADAIARVATLQKKLRDKHQTQGMERQKLAERIRALEREAAQGSSALKPEEIEAEAKRSKQVSSSSKAKAAAPPAANSGYIANASTAASSALRGGFGRLRDAALDAL